MQAPAAASSPTNTAQRSLVAFELLILGLGVIQFAFAPAAIDRPMVAISTLGTLASVILMLRISSPLRKRALLQHGLSIAVMSVAISLLAFATGASNSLFTALYCLPIVAAAIVASAGPGWLPVAAIIMAYAAIGMIGGYFAPETKGRPLPE